MLSLRAVMTNDESFIATVRALARLCILRIGVRDGAVCIARFKTRRPVGNALTIVCLRRHIEWRFVVLCW